jgi:hypothetical protein
MQVFAKSTRPLRGSPSLLSVKNFFHSLISFCRASGVGRTEPQFFSIHETISGTLRSLSWRIDAAVRSVFGIVPDASAASSSWA